MERVTCRDEQGRLLINDGPMARGDACTILLERCAAYEDTELTPEEIRQLAQVKAVGLLETTCEGCDGRGSVSRGEVYQCLYCRRNYSDKHDFAPKQCDLMNGHRETRHNSYGDAAAGVKKPQHE